MRNYSVYIRIDESKNLIHTSGITFHDFISSMDINNKNILILAGYPRRDEFCSKLNLEYISKENVIELANEDVYNYGDFCWIDFENKESLEKVSKDELAQMLYMRHMSTPFNSYKTPSLNNNYAYLSHDDGWWNNLYLDDITEYKKMLAYLLIKNLKGRKKIMTTPDEKLINWLFDLCKQGIILDFEEVKSSASDLGVYQVGNITSMDDMCRIINKYRKITTNAYIYYDSKKWTWQAC